mmetsp:Transcript_17648/g.42490  ORF Transcript_17648/g.42490 Transcript_17648/m.42490 type:complete len:407 (+) Transcript_17648:160-1380(+)
MKGAPHATAIATLLAVCITKVYGKRTIRRGLDEGSLFMPEFLVGSDRDTSTTSKSGKSKSGKEPGTGDSCGISGKWRQADAIVKLEFGQNTPEDPPEIMTKDGKNAFSFEADSLDGTLKGTYSFTEDGELGMGFTRQIRDTPLLGYYHQDTCSFKFVGGPSFATTFEGYVSDDGSMHIAALTTGGGEDIVPSSWKGSFVPFKNEVCVGRTEGEGCRTSNEEPDVNGSCESTFFESTPFALPIFVGADGFTEISLGETICGTTSSYVDEPKSGLDIMFQRDYDFYTFTLEKPGIVSATLTSGIPLVTTILALPAKCDMDPPDGFDFALLFGENSYVKFDEGSEGVFTDIKASVNLTAGEYVLLVTSDPVLTGLECDQDGESTAPYTLGLFEGLIPGSIILEEPLDVL